MKNTLRVWMMYVIIFSLNCLMTEEGVNAAKKYLIIMLLD